jgi:hypothetical protein
MADHEGCGRRDVESEARSARPWQYISGPASHFFMGSAYNFSSGESIGRMLLVSLGCVLQGLYAEGFPPF